MTAAKKDSEPVKLEDVKPPSKLTMAYDRLKDKVASNEPVFILRGQDALATATIQYWLKLASDNRLPEDKKQEVDSIISEFSSFVNKKLPG